MNNRSRVGKLAALNNWRLLAWPALTMLWFFSLPAPATAGLNYSGTFDAQEQPSGETSFSQGQNVGLQLSQAVTNFVSAKEQIRYSYHRDESEVARESVARFFDLGDANRLFRTNLSANLTTDLVDGLERSERRNLDAGFRGAWQNNFFPGLALSANHLKMQQKNLGDLPAQEILTLGTTLDWERSGLALYYNYRFSQADYGGATTQTSGAHSGSLAFNDTYWQNKFRVRFEQNYTLKNQEVAGGSAIFQFTIFISDVSTGRDVTPADNLEDPTLVNNSLMRDGDLLTPAYPVAAGSTFNNIILVLNNQVITRINLYTNPGFSADPGLTWALYSNDLLGTDWELVSPSISGVTYDVAARHFTIELAPLAAKYLKIALNYPAPTGPDVVFTEVEVFNGAAADTAPTDERATSLTLLSLSTVLSKNLQLKYQVQYDDSEVAGAASFRAEHLSQDLGLAYDSLAKSRANLDLSRSEQAELESRRYSVGFHHDFLPTLSVGLNWGRNLSYLSSLPATEMTTYRLDTTAQLYPDLQMTVGLSRHESAYLSDNTWQDGQSDALDLRLTARLEPGTTLLFSESITETKGLAATRSSESAVSLSRHISNDFYWSGRVSYATASPDQSHSFTCGTDLSIALNRLTSLSASYDYASTAPTTLSTTATPAEGGEGEATQSGRVTMKWTPRAGLALEGGMTYRTQLDPAVKEFLAFAKVAVNFRVP